MSLRRACVPMGVNARGDAQCSEGHGDFTEKCAEGADMLTTSDVAAILGVTPATVRSYNARGAMPKPDGHLGRTPWWLRDTISAWVTLRPGQGVGGGRPAN